MQKQDVTLFFSMPLDAVDYANIAASHVNRVMSFDITPYFIMLNTAYGLARYAILTCYFCLANALLPQLTDLCYLFLCQLCPRPTFYREFFGTQMRPMPSPRRAAPLHISIPHIIQICPQEQMRGIDACTNITFMKDKKTFWNRAIMQFVGYTMRPNSLAIYSASPITHARQHTDPKPTALGVWSFIYIRVKARIDAGFSRMARNKTARLPLGVAVFGVTSRRRGQNLTAATFAEFGGIGYSVHISDLLYRLLIKPRLLLAARGLSMPNYTIFGGSVYAKE